MTKKEIIERLYVLRSILSVISLRVDEVKEKEAEIEEMKRIKSYLPTTIINEKEELAKKKRIFLKPNRKKFISSVINFIISSLDINISPFIKKRHNTASIYLFSRNNSTCNPNAISTSLS